MSVLSYWELRTPLYIIHMWKKRLVLLTQFSTANVNWREKSVALPTLTLRAALVTRTPEAHSLKKWMN